jgi:hypothetical protein
LKTNEDKECLPDAQGKWASHAAHEPVHLILSNVLDLVSKAEKANEKAKRKVEEIENEVLEISIFAPCLFDS